MTSKMWLAHVCTNQVSPPFGDDKNQKTQNCCTAQDKHIFLDISGGVHLGLLNIRRRAHPGRADIRRKKDRRPKTFHEPARKAASTERGADMYNPSFNGRKNSTEWWAPLPRGPTRERGDAADVKATGNNAEESTSPPFSTVLPFLRREGYEEAALQHSIIQMFQRFVSLAHSQCHSRPSSERTSEAPSSRLCTFRCWSGSSVLHFPTSA